MSPEQQEHSHDKEWTLTELAELEKAVQGHPTLTAQRRIQLMMYVKGLRSTVNQNGSSLAWSVAHMGMESIWERLNKEDEERKLLAEYRGSCPVAQATITLPDGTKRLPWDRPQQAQSIGSLFTWNGLRKGCSMSGPAAVVFVAIMAVGLLLGGFIYWQNHETRKEARDAAAGMWGALMFGRDDGIIKDEEGNP